MNGGRFKIASMGRGGFVIVSNVTGAKYSSAPSKNKLKRHYYKHGWKIVMYDEIIESFRHVTDCLSLIVERYGK